LTVLVGDDGCGGADPRGSGLAGLRARVEALDGRLALHSSDGAGAGAGAGTVLEVKLPCG
jgi:signal transduction histidine kinase